jgi:putative heme iron utilization protein
MSEKVDLAIRDARTLMRTQHSGILSTISVSVAGYPFGSVTPFMMLGNGDLVIYASDIAQHARNMKADPKVSICINDGRQEDSQASARVTVLGLAEPDSVSYDDIERYYRLFPQARAYIKAHDFRFYTIKTTRVRYIGGFGEIYWFAEDAWRNSFVDMSVNESGAIEHMHDDHMDALHAIYEELCKQAHVADPQMLSIFQEGFHLSTDKGAVFVPYVEELKQASDLRHAMVALTKKARAQTPAQAEAV